jgi:D-glycero-D-manno-heptose 1,7-bisphosphate phosphatase
MPAAHVLPVHTRHLILDRDGVLNEEAQNHGYILQPADFKWLPNARQALAKLSQSGLRISVVSNQSAVGRGLMSQAQLDQVLDAMRDQAQAQGAHISAVYCCPHTPEAHCDCRKPAPGLVRRAVADSGIPAAQTLMVGDDVRDMEAAHAAGIAAALVRTGKGLKTAARLAERGQLPLVFDDLAQLAEHLLRDSRTS